VAHYQSENHTFVPWSVSATGTEVLAKDGTITLRGKADSAAQKDLTTEYAKDVEGVKDVKNEMTVLAAATKPGEKRQAKRWMP